MRAGLVVPLVRADAAANLATVLRLGAEAVERGAELLLLPEAALTGLGIRDDPARDLRLGETIPGPSSRALGSFCRNRGVWLGLGILERDGPRLFDAAVLLDARGRIRLKYRRIHAGWHGPRADPAVYAQGVEVRAAETPWGKVGFLLCGDLFDDGVLRRFAGTGADLLLFPFARSLGDPGEPQALWEAREAPEYCRRIRRLGCPALMVNYVAHPTLGDDGSFGGAHVVSGMGEVLASLPLLREGVLVVDTGTLAAPAR